MQGPRASARCSPRNWAWTGSRGHRTTSTWRSGFHRDGPKRAVADGHHRTPTAEGKLYICAAKEVFSRRIVGYSMDARMKSSRALTSLENAVRSRRPAGTVVIRIADPKPYSTGPAASLNYSGTTGSQDPWAGLWHAPTTPPWSRSSCCCRRTSRTVRDGSPDRTSG